jgi:hypothetical protein
MLPQPVDEVLRLLVAPHPAREVVEDGHVWELRWRCWWWRWWPRAQASVVVDGPRVGPVTLDTHRVEPVLRDQPLSDGRPCTVELGCSVAVCLGLFWVSYLVIFWCMK